jgi:protein transport protein SEC24
VRCWVTLILTLTLTPTQCALLYTTSGGERRIRVHTMAVPVVSDLAEMYKAADGPACASLLARLAVEKTLTSRLEDSRQAVVSRVLAVLKVNNPAPAQRDTVRETR